MVLCTGITIEAWLQLEYILVQENLLISEHEKNESINHKDWIS